MLHQVARRELRLLADLASWAPPAEPARTAALTGHADLVARVLLHHHEVERSAVWPALLAAVPAADADAVRAAVGDWTARCARIDAVLRDLSTAARQWAVAGTATARDAFARGCRALADAVDAQTAEEERDLVPLLDTHLTAAGWATIATAARVRLTPVEQLIVLGLAMEDACATDRARLLDGVPRSIRVAWRLTGRRRYRAAVVRLRGAPPAA